MHPALRFAPGEIRETAVRFIAYVGGVGGGQVHLHGAPALRHEGGGVALQVVHGAGQPQAAAGVGGHGGCRGAKRRGPTCWPLM